MKTKAKTYTYLVFYDAKHEPEFFVFSSLKNAVRFIRMRFLDDSNAEWKPIELGESRDFWQWEDGGTEYVSIRKLEMDEALERLTEVCEWCEGDGIVFNHKGQCLSDCKKCKGTGKIIRRK